MADLIRYDLLVQDALRGVVRQVLAETARNGLQGDHHFFITFKTTTPGLRLSNRMRERYPEEMTIILQHQFWGLAVTEAGFEVGLSFNNNPERLFVPFASVTQFQDPSVPFGCKFEVGEEAPAAIEPPPKAALSEVPKALPAKRGLAPVEAGKAEAKPRGDKAAATGSKPKPVLKVADKSEAEADDRGGPKVVSIDSFRKKP